MIIDQQILYDLTAQAKASLRLRMNMDLRNSPSDEDFRDGTAIVEKVDMMLQGINEYGIYK